jgi:predicted AlkP superfamily pyrophosphatase or phosphodiesterase
MKRALTLLVALLPVALGCAARVPRPRVVLVSVDGLWARDLQRAESAGVRLPVLDSLRRVGTLAAGVIGSFPSVTYPSHTTIITGTPPARHGIYSNRVFTPPTDTSRLEIWYWEADSIRVPTLFDAAHAAGLTTAAVGWPVTGDDTTVTYNLPEIWAARVFGDSDLAVMRRSGTPGLLDSLGAPSTGPFKDSLRVDWAAAILRRWNPDLLALHVIDLDDRKHDHGVWDDSVVLALRKVDRELGRLLDAVRESESGRQTTVAITSDHGFLDYRFGFRPGVLLARAGLVTLPDTTGRVASWDAAVLTNGGSVMILPRDSSDHTIAARIRAAIPDSLIGPGKPIRAVWPRDTLAALGSDPRAVWALDLNDGFYSSGGYRGALVGPRVGGGHGYDPRRPALHAFFLISGPGQAGNAGAILQQTEIAPLIARILGLSAF